MLSRFGPGLAALALGLAGGFLFQLVGIPLAWTLGALTMAAVVAVLMPAPLRNLVRPVLGVLAGSAFTPAVAGSMLAWWDAVLFVLLHSVVITLVGVVFFRRICRFDRITAFFASAPGGLSEITLIGASYGGHMRTLALVHSVRIITVVMVVPLVLRMVNDDMGSGVVAPVAVSAARSASRTGCFSAAARSPAISSAPSSACSAGSWLARCWSAAWCTGLG